MCLIAMTTKCYCRSILFIFISAACIRSAMARLTCLRPVCGTDGVFNVRRDVSIVNARCKEYKIKHGGLVGQI